MDFDALFPVGGVSPIFRGHDRNRGGSCAVRTLAKNRSETLGEIEANVLDGLRQALHLRVTPICQQVQPLLN